MRKFPALMIAAVVIGLAWALFSQRDSRRQTRRNPPIMQQQTPHGIQAYQGNRGRPQTDIPGAADGMDDAAARSIIAQADKMREGLDFERAQYIYSQVGLLQCSASIQQEAQRKSANCTRIAAIMQQLPMADTGALTRHVALRFKNRGALEGRLETENADSLTILLDNGVRSTIPRSEILELTPVDPSAKKSELQEEVMRMEREMPTPINALGFFQLAKLAAANGLTGMTVQYLDDALALDPDLERTVYEDEARNLLRTGLWYASIGNTGEAQKRFHRLLEKYPDSTKMDDARAFLNQLETETKQVIDLSWVATATSSSTDSAAPSTHASGRESLPRSAQDPEGILVRAGRYYQRGIEHYKMAQPGRPGANQENDKAVTAFEKAMELYRKAQQQKIGDPGQLEDLIVRCNQLIYGCRKMRTL